MFPYAKLRNPNVIATLTALELVSTKKPKLFTFVSSTSAIDTEYYVRLSDAKRAGVPENDDLEGARSELRVGYGQSKWVSEKLIMEAGRRGLHAHIVRPGYVLGHSQTAGSGFIHGTSPLNLLSVQLQIQMISSGDWSRGAYN